MDEHYINEEIEGDVEAPEPVKPVPPQAPDADVFMVPPSTGKEAWRGGSGCGPRLRLYLFAFALLALVAILVAGMSMLRQSVWATQEQGRQALVEALPFDLPSAERQRTMENLKRFQTVLEAVDDPYPMMGEFMKRVRAGLADYRLTIDEVEEINLFLEKAIQESGIPMMQLGMQIRNEELGIRKATRPPHIIDSWGEASQKVPFGELQTSVSRGRRGGNSSFLIPHSSFI